MTRTITQRAEPIKADYKSVVAATIGAQIIEPAEKKIALKSPLRYPGGKSRGAKEILTYFPPGLERVCSPFLGGGSIEIELATQGIQVFGYDIFEPVTDFWQVLLKDSEKLAKLVRKYYPLTSSKFYSLQLDYGKIRSKKERAADEATVFLCCHDERFKKAVSITLQDDKEGMAGDVRDVVVNLLDGGHIGISAKNRHEAVKHSRLSDRIDFGKENDNGF